MTERKAWSEEEDRVLKMLKEERGIHKWAEISRVMHQEFNLQGRTGKQCRERYHNHLDRTIKREQWLPQQEHDLIELHNNMGNRWAEISRAITGRSQNCVKNKFYSILRSGLRYINIAIKKYLKKYKQLDISVVYRLVQACEANYKRKNLTKEMQANEEMKKQVIFYGMKKGKQPKEDEDLSNIKSLVDQMKRFSKGSNKKQAKQSSEQLQPKKEEVDLVEPIYVFKPEPKKTSLHSMLGDIDFNDPMRSGRSKSSSYPSLRSKNLSNISNTSRRERQSFMRGHQFAPMDTIKSLQFPEFEPIKQPPPLLMMQSIYLDQGRPNNYNSFTHLLPN